MISFRFDPKENKWTKVASMMTRRLGVAVAVLSGHLYAIGGSDGQCPLNTVERYEKAIKPAEPITRNLCYVISEFCRLSCRWRCPQGRAEQYITFFPYAV
jgi:hypothetical protein